MPRPLKFFIVDDDPDMIDLMTVLLESRGHYVASSLAGTDALPKIVAQGPDCVLTDLMMAELDGLQLCGELRKNEKLEKTAIIVISARGNPYWQERAKEFGADGYVVKPVNVETFVDTLEELVRSGGRKTG